MTAAADRLDEAMDNKVGRAWPELLVRFRAAEQALREIAAVRPRPSGPGLADDPAGALERCRRIAVRALAQLERDV